MSNFSAAELVIIAFLIVVFFGSKRIPEFIKGMGEAIREFKKALKEE